jgi:membrane-associated protease RseP (regulator of RpoE activity)
VKTDDDLRADAPEERAGPERAAEVPVPDRRLMLTLLITFVALLALSGGFPLLIVVASIIIMIVLHELGHFLTAKWSGMKVTEFFLGFGPKVWSFRRGETEYGIKAIPAGAYVRIIGMNNLEEVPPEDEPRTYREQTYPRRFAVAVAGSAMHFLQALVVIFIALTIVGTPGGHIFTSTSSWRIKDVTPDSAAAAAHLQPGDRVISVDGTNVETFDQVHDVLVAHAGKTVTLVVDRNGQRFDATTTLGTDQTKGILGIRPEAPPTMRLDPIHAIGQTGTEFTEVTRGTLGFFGSFFSPSGLSGFAHDVLHPGGTPTVNDGNGSSSAAASSSSADSNRPVSIIGAARLGSELTQEGPLTFILFFASINIVIGLFNLIPLLPLDGGHLVIATYERIRSRRGRPYHADVVKLLPLTYAVVLLLIVLGASTIFLDVVNPIHLN